MINKTINDLFIRPPYQPDIFPNYYPNPNVKPFKLGFLLGRMQHVHVGHEMIINTALGVCDKVILLVGSAQEEKTLRNPFSASKRVDLLKKIYDTNPNLIIDVIADLTHENDHSYEWGRYVLSRVVEVAHSRGIGYNPEVMIYGNDEERKGWFDPNDIEHVSQLVMTRGNINISATKIREFIAENNFWKWRQYTNEKIHGDFPELRRTLLELDEYKESANHEGIS